MLGICLPTMVGRCTLLYVPGIPPWVHRASSRPTAAVCTPSMPAVGLPR